MKGRIDDSEVYLSEDQLPAVTSSIADLIEPTKVRGVRTTTGRVVNTKEARRILGSEKMSRINPSERHLLRLGNDNVDLFRSQIVATNFDRDIIEFQSIGGNASWFLWAKNTKMKDIRWKRPLDGRDLMTFDTTSANIKGTWVNPTGLVLFPLIDYGGFFAQGSSFDVTPIMMRPALRAYRFLESAFGDIGYTIRPRGMLAGEWTKYIIQGPTKKARSISDGTDLLERLIVADPPSFGGDDDIFNFTVQITTNLEIADDIDFPAFANANSFFEKTEDGVLYVTLSGLWIRFVPTGPMPAGGYQFRVHVWDQTDGVELAYWDRPATTAPDATPDANDWYRFDHMFDPFFALDGHQIGLRLTCLNDAILGVDVVKPNGQTGVAVIFQESTEYAVDKPLYVPSVAPDWTIAHLLIKVIGAARCLAFDTDDLSREVNVWFYDEYFAAPNPAIPTRDWRKRADHTVAPERIVPEKPVSYRLRYAEDSADALLEKYDRITGDPYGSSTQLVPDGYLDEVAIEVGCAATVMVTTFEDVFIPAMHKEDVNTAQDDSYEFKPRLLIHDGVAEGEWTYDGGSETEYPKVYFAHRDTDAVRIAFGNVPQFSGGKYNEHWGLRLRHLVNDQLKIRLRIRDTEVMNFNHGTPTLVDDGSGPLWYHVAEFQQHRLLKSEPTTCILLTSAPTSRPSTDEPLVCRYAMLVEGGSIDGLYTYVPPDSWIYPGGVPGDDNISPISGAWGMFSGGVGIYLTLTPPPATPGPWTGWVDYATGLIPGPTVTLVC